MIEYGGFWGYNARRVYIVCAGVPMTKKRLAKANMYDLTRGGILSKLMVVSLPLIGTQIIQMVYNLTDMFWLGRMGSYSGVAVAASGSVGLYLWLSMAFSAFGGRGAEIGVAQNVGRGDRESARLIGQSAYTLAALIGLGFMAFLILLSEPLIGFLNLSAEVRVPARNYLLIVALGIPFNFISASAIGVFNGSGNSRTPFIINCISLGLNIVLDPLFIFTFGMGVEGAAVATVLAQIVSAVLLTLALRHPGLRPLDGFKPFARVIIEDIRLIIRWTLPIALESLLFTTLTMLLSRMINAYGTDVTAAQRVASQVESLSWLIGGGFASALTAYVGQNFGALKWRRIRRGFSISTALMAGWGLIVTLTLYFAGGSLFRIFMPDNEAVVSVGVAYLRILAFSQLLQCLEGIAAGSFRGMGKTVPPFISSATSNLLRVVAAYFLSRGPMGLTGIYVSVTAGAALRGAWIYLWYLFYMRSLPHQDGEEPAAA